VHTTKSDYQSLTQLRVTTTATKKNHLYPNGFLSRKAIAGLKKLRAAHPDNRKGRYSQMNEIFFLIVDILPRLGGLIKQKRLTEILEGLEYLGYCGDDATALLAYLQTGVAS